MLSDDEMNDQVWNALILQAIKYSSRAGRFRAERSSRDAVYLCKIITNLALILIETGVIRPWPAGFRRLRTLEDRAVTDFRRIHKKFHTYQ